MPPPADDRRSFEELYERTSRPLWAYLRRVGGDPELADELHQEAFLRYLKRPYAGEDERHRSAYLFRIATNLLRDRWRHRSRWRRRWQLFRPPTETAARAAQIDLKLDLGPVLGELEPRDRALLWLTHVEERSHREVAEILGLRPASVRVMLFRARGRLAKVLEKQGLTGAPAPMTGAQHEATRA